MTKAKPTMEEEVVSRIQEMRDEELIQLLRGAVVDLEALADRLESKLNEGGAPRGVA